MKPLYTHLGQTFSQTDNYDVITNGQLYFAAAIAITVLITGIYFAIKENRTQNFS